MPTQHNNPEEIFYNAIEIPDPAKRPDYLDQACGDDKQLRDQVEALIKNYEQADSFLEVPPVDADMTLDSPPQTEGVGTKIGHYELLQLTGEGGMDLVYLAQ